MMRNVRFVGRGIALLALLAPALAAPARAESLSWKFKKGDVYHYVQTQKTNTKTEIQGNKIDQDMSMIMDLTWTVKDVSSDGSAQMAQTIDRLRMMMKFPGGMELNYDSKDEKAPEGPLAAMEPVFKGLVGTPIDLTMTARGEVKDVTVPDKLVEAMKAAGPGAGQLGSAEGLKKMISQASLVLPEGEISSGKSWNSKMEVPSPIGVMTLSNTYTYKGADTLDGKKLEKIVLETKTELAENPDAPVKVKIAEQDTSGAFFFDKAAGRLQASQAKGVIKMTISAQGMEIVSNVTTEAKMEAAKGDSASSPK